MCRGIGWRTSTMATERLFEESLKQAQVKARIVQKYFWP
jgi:hypothetical protein